VSGNPCKTLDARLVGDIYTSDESMLNLRALCDRFGHRFAGSESERRASQFLARQLDAYGLADAHVESFPYPGWRRGRSAKLSITSPVRRSVPCLALPYCPPTGQKGVEGELLDLGDGAPSDFRQQRRRLRGRCVMVNSAPLSYLGRWVHRVEKYGRAVAGGAAAFIFANHYDGLLPPTGTLRFGRRAEIPGVGISKEHAASLARLAEEQTLTARLVTADRFFRARGCNVVADIPGRSEEELILVGAHFDGHDISVAAHDNGSGVAAILEAARVLCQHRAELKRTIRVVFWSGEEIGLVGSHAYVEQHRDRLRDVRLCLNVDGVPAGRAKGIVSAGWPELKPFVQAAARQMCTPMPFASQVNAHSDHYSFFLEGVPAVSLGNLDKPFEGRGYGHTAADTLDKVDLRDLQEAAAVIARLLVRFANAERWPLKHHDRRWARKQLDDAGLTEAMKYELSPPFDTQRRR